jgi:probable F420-dependent oxidoreductase
MSYNTDRGIDVVDLAREAESRGFDSIWVPEHTHIPASRLSPFPGGTDLPEPYYRMADPFVSLAAAASVTQKIKLGTGICLVVQHDPIVLAKTVATLDRVSNGRVLFGIGGGWNREEMENHGFSFDRRWKLLRERIEAMKCLWADDEEASYDGEFVSFERIISQPKPIQRPYPPIWLGGMLGSSLKRVVRYCDGWMPIDALFQRSPETMDQLDEMARETGRDPASIERSIFCQLKPDRDQLNRYQDMGFESAIIALPWKGRDGALAVMDKYGDIIG